MKKRFLSLTLAALMTAAIPFSVSAELTEVQKSVKVGVDSEVLVDDVFSHGNAWKTYVYDSDFSKYDNLKSDGTYTWIQSMKFTDNTWGSDVFNSLYIYKNFVSPTLKNTLVLEAVVKPESCTTVQNQDVFLNLENGDATKKFTVFKYSIKPGVGCVAEIADANNKTEESWNLDILKKDVKVTATIKPSDSGFTAKVVLTDAADGTVLLESDDVELDQSIVRSFSNVKFRANAGWIVEERNGEENVLGIKSVKLTKLSNKEVLFADTGERLNERLYDLKVDDNKYYAGDGGTLSNDVYNAGNEWESDKVAHENHAFDAENGFLMFKKHNGWFGGGGTLSKKFEPANAGDSLKMSFEFIVKDQTEGDIDQTLTRKIYLTNDDGTAVLNIFTLIRNVEVESELKVVGINDDSYAKTWNFWHYHNDQTALRTGNIYNVELNLVPADENNYNATIVVKQEKEGTVVGELSNSDEPFKISRDMVSKLNTVKMLSSTSWGTNGFAANYATFGVRNMKITTSSSASSKLKTGENKIYVPYEKVSNEPLTAVICAAVVNADGVQTDFDVVPMNEVIKNRDNVELTVNVGNADTDYVRVFVFDSLKGLTPLRSSLSTK